MTTPIQIGAQGLVVEAESWQSMIDEVRAVRPELLALNKMALSDLSLTFRAEPHSDLAVD